LNNGWENATVGVGVWYADNSYHNIALKLKTQGTKTVSNSRAELGAILEALRQNEDDDLVIESDSLTSLRAICNLSNTHEDLNWSGIRNADLLKGILIRLRTRLAKTSFRWVKGHANNYGNNQADHLANAGRESEFSLRADEEDWLSSHPALQDGARLQTLEAKHIYDILLRWHT
jgi:ribonuclease HI